MTGKRTFILGISVFLTTNYEAIHLGQKPRPWPGSCECGEEEEERRQQGKALHSVYLFTGMTQRALEADKSCVVDRSRDMKIEFAQKLWLARILIARACSIRP